MDDLYTYAACSPCMVSLSSVAARRRAHQLHDCRSSAASDSCAVQAAVLAAAWCRSCIRVQETFPERTFHPRWLRLLISCTIPPSVLSESLSLSGLSVLGCSSSACAPIARLPIFSRFRFLHNCQFCSSYFPDTTGLLQGTRSVF